MPEPIVAVPMSIALFAGYAETAPAEVVRLESLDEFTNAFGAPAPGYHLARAVELFYRNGGGAAYVAAVGQYGQTPQAADFLAPLEVLPDIGEIGLVVMPDMVLLDAIDHAAVTSAMLEACARHPRAFAIIDLPAGPALATAAAFRSTFHSSYGSYGAAYVPWLDAAAAVPPGGAVAGICAQTERDAGVWQSPADLAIAGVQGPVELLSNDDQEKLSVDEPISINAIRYFESMGTVVWGARTLDAMSNDFRYVSLRRLDSLLGTSIRIGLQQFAAEPNNAATWQAVDELITTFLDGMWVAKALAGDTPNRAFHVAVGHDTMTPQDIEEGRLIVQVEYAPRLPAEFVLLQIEQIVQAP